jgi:transposase-like protein
MAAVLNTSMNSTSSSSSLGIPEEARRATEGMPWDAAPPDPEVVATARRRQYSGTEKRALLAEADRHKAAGTLGAFLRSKRIYSSMLSSWRKQLGAADRVALAPKRRGPKPDPAARQIEQLNRENARLRRKLEHAELIIDAQKKLCAVLGLPTSDDRTPEER